MRDLTTETPEERGSRTAKGGFDNEDDVVEKFNSWPNDLHSRDWIIELGFVSKEVKSVNARKVVGQFKADVRVEIDGPAFKECNSIGLQVKLVTSEASFNQIDKRWVDKYVEMWNIPPNVSKTLKRFTGEIKPLAGKGRNAKRLLISEFSSAERHDLISFFEVNKEIVLTDLFRGRGENTADFVLVVRKTSDSQYQWGLRPIRDVIALMSQGPVQVSPRGSLQIGKVLMQRKGGDNGRDTANMLQFKIDPSILLPLTNR